MPTLQQGKIQKYLSFKVRVRNSPVQDGHKRTAAVGNAGAGGLQDASSIDPLGLENKKRKINIRYRIINNLRKGVKKHIKVTDRSTTLEF